MRFWAAPWPHMYERILILHYTENNLYLLKGHTIFQKYTICYNFISNRYNNSAFCMNLSQYKISACCQDPSLLTTSGYKFVLICDGHTTLIIIL